MRKTMKRFAALIAGMVIVFGSSMVVCAEEGYTYNFDYWGDIQYSPDAYSVVGVYTSVELGLDKRLSSPSGLYVYDNFVYICDTGNNRILELERTGADSLELVREIESFRGNVENNTFSSPSDIAVTDDGFMFICDKNNNRILKLDMDLNYIMEFVKPDDANFNQDMSFLPSKLAVDSAGRIYCIATNVNKGLIKYEADGEFSGFVGATPVTYDWTDYIWKKLATKEQREQMASFVPTEYDNVYMDHDGFIYAVTSTVSEADLDSGAIDSVRRLNLMGKDILIRNGNWYVIGDIHWGEGGGFTGPSLMTDVTAFDNDTYAVLDKNRGRIFGYDDQGRLLWGFGGSGNMDGYFKNPTAIDHMDRDILVLDALDCSLTLFTQTEFGKKVFNAIEQFQNGEYEKSGESWQEVMDMNGNYDLAYIGIGRALLRQEKYHEAMDYFELKWDADNYSKAYKQYRKEWVEDHIVLIILILFAALCLPLIIGRIKKVKQEIDTADIFKE